MRGAIIFFVGLSVLLTSLIAKADAFDDKANAAATQQQQVAQSKADAARMRALLSNNSYMIHRVPRNASITECFSLSAQIWRKESNGCRLENTQWNGVPVQVCSEDYNQNFPPEIVACHYRLANGQDCEIVRNASIKPQCY